MTLFRSRRLGFVFQDFNLLDSLTPPEKIMLPLILDEVPGQEVEPKAHKIASKKEV